MGPGSNGGGDVLIEQSEAGLADEVGEVGHAAGGESCRRLGRSGPGEQSVGEVRAEESGSAGDEERESCDSVSPGYAVKPAVGRAYCSVASPSGPTLGRGGFDRGVLEACLY